MNSFRVSCMLTGMLLTLAAGTAHASLIGDTIDAELLINGSNLDGPDSVVVGAGVEGNWLDEIEYDIDANTITVSSIIDDVNLGWNTNLAFSFTDLDWLPTPGAIIGVSVISATGEGWSLIDDSDVSFTADSVLIDASEIAGNFQVAFDQSVTIELTTVHIPEPSTLALTACGLLGLAFAARKKRRG